MEPINHDQANVIVDANANGMDIRGLLLGAAKRITALSGATLAGIATSFGALVVLGPTAGFLSLAMRGVEIKIVSIVATGGILGSGGYAGIETYRAIMSYLNPPRDSR